MIKLKNITVKLNNQDIFKNLSATIQDGDFITIVGPNGSGKSTLLNVIAGTIKPTSGVISVSGEDVTTVGELDRASYIARLFQDPLKNCVPTLTVAQNLSLAMLKSRSACLRNMMNSFPEQAVENILRPMIENIGELLNKPMGMLSGGQRQMISLAMTTISHFPKILLLDEPTAALDPQAATKMLLFSAKFIKKYNITTLLITHDPYIALHLGNRLWIIRDGIIEEISQEEKKKISPDSLLGEIDYSQLAAEGI